MRRGRFEPRPPPEVHVPWPVLVHLPEKGWRRKLWLFTVAWLPFSATYLARQLRLDTAALSWINRHWDAYSVKVVLAGSPRFCAVLRHKIMKSGAWVNECPVYNTWSDYKQDALGNIFLVEVFDNIQPYNYGLTMHPLPVRTFTGFGHKVRG
tara:strand:+ start:166 stop:621 length:456 start_codon:yes stop_codon:yes gene_type:complete